MDPVDHYLKHNDNLTNLDIDRAYKGTFMDQPKEQFWIDELNSNINLAKTAPSDLS